MWGGREGEMGFEMVWFGGRGWIGPCLDLFVLLDLHVILGVGWRDVYCTDHTSSHTKAAAKRMETIALTV